MPAYNKRFLLSDHCPATPSAGRGRTLDQVRVAQDEFRELEACFPLVAARASFQQILREAQSYASALPRSKSAQGAGTPRVCFVAPAVTSCASLPFPRVRPFNLCNSLVATAGCQQVKQDMHVAYHWGCEQRGVLVIQSLADLEAISLSSQYHAAQQAPVDQQSYLGEPHEVSIEEVSN